MKILTKKQFYIKIKEKVYLIEPNINDINILKLLNDEFQLCVWLSIKKKIIWIKLKDIDNQFKFMLPKIIMKKTLWN